MDKDETLARFEQFEQLFLERFDRFEALLAEATADFFSIKRAARTTSLCGSP